ncbi:MAG: hypothetical protein Q8N18_02075 [Opitutaceae bacterium]|nr:hypothetical protein [Opitutaceae bacterium]
MNATRPLKVIFSLLALALAGCEFEAPITEKPTQPTKDKLVGTWKSVKGGEVMKVRQLDAATYVVSYDGDLYAAHHSDLGGVPFVSVLHLAPENRKHAFVTWRLSDADDRLTLRVVSSKVIPKETRGSTELRELLGQQAQNTELLGPEFHYVRER